MLSPGADRSHFYPDAAPILIKLIGDQKTRKVLGAQILGLGEASKRLDVLATALRFGATADDLATLDLGYSPPYSEALDNVIQAANIMRNKLDGLAQSVSPVTVKQKLERNDDFILLDVRTPAEFAQRRINAPQVQLLPLSKLRDSLDELPRDKEIVSTCQISLRGYETFRILKGAGFDKVAFLDGGIAAWPYALALGSAGKTG